MPEDEESSGETPIGYLGLANQMAAGPEYGMFDSFPMLENLNLLYYAAELKHHETELLKLEPRDWNWAMLVEGANGTPSPAWMYFRKHIRPRLREFGTALMLSSAIRNLPKPSYWDWDIVRAYVTRKADSNGIRGSEAEVYKNWSSQLIALKERNFHASLSKSYAIPFTRLFHRAGGHRWRKKDPRKAGHAWYPDASADRILSIFECLVTSLAQVGVIWVLLVVPTIEKRLGTMAAFHGLLSGAMYLAKCSLKETVMATAAFAAIEAIFVSNLPDSSSGVSQIPKNGTVVA